MSTVSVTNNFVNATTAVADDVDTNFNDLVSYINDNCILRDGTKQFTAQQSVLAATDPTGDDHVTRKLYVDRRVGAVASTTTSATDGFAIADTYEDIDTVTITVPNGKAVKIFAWAEGVCFGAGVSTEYVGKVGISLTGAAGGLAYGQQGFACSVGNGKASVHCSHYVTGTTSAASVMVRFQAAQNSVLGLGALASVFEPNIKVLVVPNTSLVL